MEFEKRCKVLGLLAQRTRKVRVNEPAKSSDLALGECDRPSLLSLPEPLQSPVSDRAAGTRFGGLLGA